MTTMAGSGGQQVPRPDAELLGDGSVVLRSQGLRDVQRLVLLGLREVQARDAIVRHGAWSR